MLDEGLERVDRAAAAARVALNLRGVAVEEISRGEGKPEAALPKIVEGRVNGFFKENVLLEQPFAKEPKKTVAKVLGEDQKSFVLDKGVARFFADAEAIYSYEGTREVNTLIVGRAVTGQGAFV